MRVQRDIPAQLIVSGVKKSNLRQLVQQRLKAEGSRCRCIRCREVGHRLVMDGVRPNLENVQISSLKYEASEGQEVFISAEDRKDDVLLGYLRLRIPSGKAHRPEITAEPCSIVRELHVYGPLVPVGKHLAKAWQHKGLGASLLAEAERISREGYGLNRVLVISALGTKEYYKRFGYRHDGVYVSKSLGNYG
jgi:elongator complex protein 3